MKTPSKKVVLSVAVVLTSLFLTYKCTAIGVHMSDGNSIKNSDLTVIKRLKVDSFINAVAWNEDGSRLAALSKYGGVITIWDTKTWEVINEFTRFSGPYSHNSFSYLPDGTLLVSAPLGSDNLKYPDLSVFSLIQLDPVSGKILRYFPDVSEHPEKIPVGRHFTETFAVSPDGALVAGISGGRLGNVFVYDLKTGQLVSDISLPEPESPIKYEVIYSLVFSPNSQELAIGSTNRENGKVSFFEPRTGNLKRSFAAFPPAYDSYDIPALAYSDDGHYIATAKTKALNTRLPNTIATNIWRADTGEAVDGLRGVVYDFAGKDETVSVNALAWHGDMLASGNSVGLQVYSTKEPRQLMGEFSKGEGLGANSNSYSVKISNSGVLAASMGSDILVMQSKYSNNK